MHGSDLGWGASIDLLLVHCQGELGKVIVGGVAPIPGATVLEQMNHLNSGHDAVRRVVTLELCALISDQVSVSHPDIAGLDHIAYLMWRSYDANGALRTCTTLPPGRVDRSPCGTGSSANLAVEHARGRLTTGDVRISRSIIGGEFTAEALGVTTVGDRVAVLPRITGRGYVYGTESLRVDDADPFPDGWALSDTWGPHLDHLG